MLITEPNRKKDKSERAEITARSSRLSAARIHIYICIHMYIYVYICIYIYVCVHELPRDTWAQLEEQIGETVTHW